MMVGVSWFKFHGGKDCELRHGSNNKHTPVKPAVKLPQVSKDNMATWHRHQTLDPGLMLPPSELRFNIPLDTK